MDFETLENFENAETFEDQSQATQAMINAQAWGLEGSTGRAMMDAIKQGACLLGLEGCRDYWGNYIPSRHEVKQGTKGSFDFVTERMGLEHAQAMENLTA